MRNYNTNSNKSDGFTTSPVTVELNGRSIEAVHHFTNETDTLLNLYIDTREGGIDVVMPLASDKPAYALSERGEEVLGFTEDTHDRVEYAEHPPVDLPGAGPYTPAFTDVDETRVRDGDE